MVLLRNTLRVAVGGVGLGAGVPAGYQAWKSAEDLEGFFTALASLFPALLHRASAVLSAAPASSHTAAQNAEISAILVAQQSLSSTLQYLMRSQNLTSSSSMLSALLPLGLLGALAAAWWKWGWEGFGWVSLEQLEENLETVRKYVAEKLEELKGEMLRRFSSIGEMLTQCTQRVEQVNDSVLGLQRDVSNVNTTLSSVDRRMESVENNTERTAEGVELLVRLVSSSRILDGADAASVRELHAFAGSPELMAPPAQPQLAAAPAAMDRSSSSSVMRALLTPSSVASY